MFKRVLYREKQAGVLLASAALAACLVIGVERAAAFRGGFGGFHGGGGFGGFRGGGSHFGGARGGGSRFGDGGFGDRRY